MVTFKEYYLLEGFSFPFLNKLKNKISEIKHELITKDEYGDPKNTRKIHNLDQEISAILTSVKNINKTLFEKLGYWILEQMNKKIIGNIRLGFIVLLALHGIAIAGMKGFHDTKQSRAEKEGYRFDKSGEIILNPFDKDTLGDNYYLKNR